MYGFSERRVAPAGAGPSDLAAAAGTRVLADAELSPDEIDLLIFAAVFGEVQEPATAHIVADKLGITAPVFDVMNACNGVLNAMELADALIRAGQYTRVLIVTGECGSALSRLPVRDRAELARLLPVLTVGDIGAALIMEASDRPGLLGSHFTANSAGWHSAVITNPYMPPHLGTMSVRFAPTALAASFAGMEKAVPDALRTMGRKMGDIDLFCVHQPSVAFTSTICRALDIPPDKVIATFSRYGNATTASLPLQLAKAVEHGRLRRGDLVALFGLASGASAGLVLMEW
ncbi:3-oxoacyl-ACP synthase III family protein [Streptomyces candidus]|uniref:3-oxoacyl-ACP synthase III family protein n=1 Tax=Streptomyces candidus TaxID=67283 RepID=UPI0021AA8374|nr:3-oxoacyl-[acyl-carrier-protein] synthase III C-terminal domain-containing protein [Streptomyces candidus]